MNFGRLYHPDFARAADKVVEKQGRKMGPDARFVQYRAAYMRAVFIDNTEPIDGMTVLATFREAETYAAYRLTQKKGT